MNRTRILGGVALLGLLLWSAGLRLLADEKHVEGHYEKCAKACAECQVQCDSCFRHCADLVSEGKKDHTRTMHLCADCGEVCTTAAKLSARHSPLAVPTCEACAKACDQCGDACEKFPADDHMKACARSCRECAKACREMIKHAEHEKK
jgi:hypothetical protein